MKKILYSILVSICFMACRPSVVHTVKLDKLPEIWPDYTDVTIPDGIAPMNFNFIGMPYNYMLLTVKGSKGGELSCYGKTVEMDIDEWHSLTSQNKGGYLDFYVSYIVNKIQTDYKPFRMYVSDYDLDDYGLTYRLVAPGYVSYGKMGIYCRNLSNFDEDPIFETSSVNGTCVNCHTSNRTDQSDYVFHVRGHAFGGTIVKHNGKTTVYNSTTAKTLGAAVYPYWHKDGRWLAFSSNNTFQVFHTANNKRIEVFDKNSDLEIFDAESGKLVLSDNIKVDTIMETFPAFSPDGNSLYFCEAKLPIPPYFLEDVKYSLMKVGFDSNTGKTVGQPDTLVSIADKSITHPRPSYDGKYLMFTVADYGTFPIWHSEADLYMYNFADSTCKPLTAANSNDTESFHNWSSNSHWFVFTSRRTDGLYTRLYIASVDDKGNCTKPFLLPQENPLKYYDALFYSYNTPDFAKQKTEVSHISMRKIISDTLDRKQFGIQ